MTTRERFRRVMAGDAAVDRLPAIEWAYWWDKTLELWYGQGLPRGLDEAAMADFVGIDRNTQVWLPHKIPDCPRETSHGRGIVENESDYERLRPYLLPENAVQQMLPKIRQTLPFYENGQTLVWYTLDGFFWWPRTLLGIENHLYSFYDQPELYHRICEDLLEWQIAQVDALARYMKPDFMTIAEDMSYNHGPMLSEELFNEFIKPYYQRLIPEIKKHGTRVFVDSDGDVTRAVPWFRGAGVEGILPLDGDIDIFVGPSSFRVDPATVEAFRVPQGTFVKLNPGVLHGRQFVVNTPAVNVLVLLPERTFGNDCTFTMLEGEDRIRILP